MQYLEKVCGVIAADESRHEIAYTKIVDELFKRDPNGTMLAFEDMMRKQIVMPAHLMTDLVHEQNNSGRNLFADFSDVAQRLGVYTAQDYAGIMEHLVRRCASPPAATRLAFFCGLWALSELAEPVVFGALLGSRWNL